MEELKSKIILAGWFVNKDATDLIIYVPKNTIFEDIKIDAGAGEIEIESLETKVLSLELGAGTVQIDNLVVGNRAKIDGGAGKVDILSGEIHNLDLDMGAGKFAINSRLIGETEIDQGVGKLDVNLTDDIQNYKIKVDKGIGRITVDGKEVRDGEVIGTSNENYIKIDGGIGEIEIK